MELPSSPAFPRNGAPIEDALRPTGMAAGAKAVLEVASGPGEHARRYAQAFPEAVWQPTEFDAAMVPVIAERTKDLSNVREPMQLDAGALPWPCEKEAYDALLCINMTHISPWQSTLGLVAGAAHCLKAGGELLIYGPFTRNGRFNGESDEAFHASLCARNAAWGYRNVEDVSEEAAKHGFVLRDVRDMPANNFFLKFEKTPSV